MGYFENVVIALFLGTGFCGSEFTVAHAAEVVDPADPLKALEGLVGDWTGETTTNGIKVTIAITYEWLYDQKYLLAHVERRTGAAPLLKSTLVYLWDPEAQKIRLWFISSNGSWSQATVKIDKGMVLLDTKGINDKGEPFAVITNLGQINQDVRTETFRDLTVGGKPQEVDPPIVWKRKTAR
jgi:hypothetical protein